MVGKKNLRETEIARFTHLHWLSRMGNARRTKELQAVNWVMVGRRDWL